MAIIADLMTLHLLSAYQRHARELVNMHAGRQAAHVLRPLRRDGNRRHLFSFPMLEAARAAPLLSLQCLIF